MYSIASIQRTISKKIVSAFFGALLAMGMTDALAAPSLQFAKTPDNATISPGAVATFSYFVQNSGPDPANFPQLVDNLPGGGGIVWSTLSPACSIYDDPPAQRLECDFNVLGTGEQATATVTGVPTSCTVLTSTAFVTSQNNLPQTLSDMGTITVSCGRPMFVIGDLEPHAPGTVVNFWGAQWWSNNGLSAGADSGVASFKGYATNADSVCGGTWMSRPGNSSNPPAKIPTDIMVIVTDTVRKNGPNISGNIKKIVVVHSDGHYGPAPGHRGNGTVASVFCK